MELNFRDKQLEKLRNEIRDLDELSDGVVLSDFTLDYFFTQLLKYLERNRAELGRNTRRCLCSYGQYHRYDEQRCYLLPQTAECKH